MPIKLSYTNVRGEEIVLDHTEPTGFLWELYGREGFEAPELDYTEITYADGSTKVIAVNMKPRVVTLYFACRVGTPRLREKLEDLKQKLIQTGSSDKSWGTLKVMRPDGRYMFLNCVYTGGLDDYTRDYPRVVKFDLTFRAQDPLFYDGFEQSYTIQQSDRDGYLFFDPDLYMADAEIVNSQEDAIAITGEKTQGNLWWSIGNGRYYAIKPAASVYMRTAKMNLGDEIFLNGEKAYPTIIINGPAENIRLTNKNTGRTIGLDTSVMLNINERITITTQPLNRKITMRNKSGATSNLMSKLTEDSSLDWWLVRGTNQITFENSATTPESYVKFTYKDGYLSAI